MTLVLRFAKVMFIEEFSGWTLFYVSLIEIPLQSFESIVKMIVLLLLLDNKKNIDSVAEQSCGRQTTYLDWTIVLAQLTCMQANIEYNNDMSSCLYN